MVDQRPTFEFRDDELPAMSDDVELVQTFGGEAFYVQTGPSPLARARALFLADRITVDEFERFVERALACVPETGPLLDDIDDALFALPHMDRLDG